LKPRQGNALIYSGCQNNVPMAGRYFATTPYAANLFFGTLL
jgi:hypothetical protein